MRSGVSPLLGLWWGSWILASVVFHLITRMGRRPNPTLDELGHMTTLSIMWYAGWLAATILVMVMIWALRSRQQEKLALLARKGFATEDE